MTEKTQPAKTINGIILALVVVILFSAGSKIFSIVVGQNISPDIRFLITRLVFWGCFAAIYLYVTKKQKEPFLLWPERVYAPYYYVLSVIVILLIILLGAVVVSSLLKYLGLLQRSEIITTINHLSVPVKLFTAVTAGLLEELIFRGYLIPRLQMRFNNKHLSVIFTGVLFGLLHFGYGTVVNVIVPVMIGLIFGYHYFKYRNLKILIICHTLIDLNALFMSAFLKHH